MNQMILQETARMYGTPCYLFDLDSFAIRANQVQQAFGEEVNLCYSIKANPFLLRELPTIFRYIEVCSPGELTICEKVDVDKRKIIFSGVNKTKEEVLRAMQDGVGIFTAESLLHLRYIHACACESGVTVPVLLRLSSGNQFGMDEQDLREIIRNRQEYSNVDLIGIHYFTGTQKKKASVIAKELEILEEFCQSLKAKYGFTVKHVEYGPGLAVDYFQDQTEETDLALLHAVAEPIRAFAKKYPLTIEMGRFFAAPCGTYLTKVADTKQTKGIRYAICDGGIHHLNYYGQGLAQKVPFITVLNSREDEVPQEDWMLCGSLCTTADVLVRNVQLPALQLGDVLAFHRCGAYSVSEGIAAFLSRAMPRVVFYSEKDGLQMVRDSFATDVLNTPVTGKEGVL